MTVLPEVAGQNQASKYDERHPHRHYQEKAKKAKKATGKPSRRDEADYVPDTACNATDIHDIARPQCMHMQVPKLGRLRGQMRAK